MQTVQKEADKRARKIQLIFTQFFITNKRKQPTKEKRKTKNKHTKGRTSTLGYQKTINAESSHKEWENKNNHRKQFITKKKQN
jgi:hypothetical protein